MGQIAVASSVLIVACGCPCGPVAASQPDQPKIGVPFRDCEDCPEMIVVPAGRFTMGSPDDENGRAGNEGPARVVTIPRPFAVSRFEITRCQYAQFVRESRPDSGQRCVVWKGSRGGEPVEGKNGRDANFVQRDDRPVVCITWDDARRFSFGDAADDLCRYANVADAAAREGGGGTDWEHGNCRDGYGTATAPVGPFLPNPFGLYDVHANVWEWTQDRYHDSYAGAPDDGSAWTSGEGKSRGELGLAAVPDFHNFNLGLRVARTLD